MTDLGFDAEDDPILFETEGFAEVSGHQISKVISLPNRDWVVEFRIGSLISNGGYLVLVGMASVGVMISFLLAYIVNLQVREKERLSDMLDKKTEELRFLVEHDSLTELLNRRAFNTKLKGWLKSKPRFCMGETASSLRLRAVPVFWIFNIGSVPVVNTGVLACAEILKSNKNINLSIFYV